jgi:NAD(P)-dependent dehydrogenase (short-subunit alcohol dehydrogenase family)
VAEGVAAAIDTFGSIDILVNNATFQRTSEIFDEIPNDEFE